MYLFLIKSLLEPNYRDLIINKYRFKNLIEKKKSLFKDLFKNNK